MSVVTTLTTSLEDPFNILVSNLASLAINNHFFLDHLVRSSFMATYSKLIMCIETSTIKRLNISR